MVLYWKKLHTYCFPNVHFQRCPSRQMNGLAAERFLLRQKWWQMQLSDHLGMLSHTELYNLPPQSTMNCQKGQRIPMDYGCTESQSAQRCISLTFLYNSRRLFGSSASYSANRTTEAVLYIYITNIQSHAAALLAADWLIIPIIWQNYISMGG